MIREYVGKGKTTYGVMVYEGAVRRWVGTYPTREAAEEAQRLARPPRRRCARCGRSFHPPDDRRVRCDACIAWKRYEQPANDDHWLYRCVDADDRLLYVGITSNGIKRFRRHGNDRSWWRQVARIEVEHFDTAQDAAEAEREAIRDERPLHNRKGVSRSDIDCPACGYPLDDDEDQYECPLCGMTPREWRRQQNGGAA